MTSRFVEGAKFLETSELEGFSRISKAKRKSVVLCHGVFDVLHLGHLDYLREAKSLGDVLVVSVTSDAFVNKGPGRPIFSLRERLELLASLSMVDFVVESNSESAVEIISSLSPNFYVKGPDYRNANADASGRIVKESSAVVELGGTVYFTSGPTDSSTRIARLLNSSSSPNSKWIKDFSSRFSLEDVRAALDGVSGLKVLVVGEIIVDEYVTVEPLGKSSKEPLLAFRELGRELQLGGSLAVARHLSGLGCDVTLASALGLSDELTGFIRQETPSDIDLRLTEFSSVPTTRKTRYVEKTSGARVFEKYIMDEFPDYQDLNDFAELLPDLVFQSDIVIICDYGHGLMNAQIIQVVEDGSKLLAVNTQSNAGNRGLNSITKYSAPGLVCLNGSEVEQEIRKRGISTKDMAIQLLETTKSNAVVVTQGAQGLSVAGRDILEPFSSPAFGDKIVDRVGAGDALYSAFAAMWATGVNPEISAFLANLAGAHSIAEVGNRNTLTRDTVLKYASGILS